MISACVCEREEEEERNDGKKKSFIGSLGKWNENNTENKSKEKEITPNKNSLTFN